MGGPYDPVQFTALEPWGGIVQSTASSTGHGHRPADRDRIQGLDQGRVVARLCQARESSAIATAPPSIGPTATIVEVDPKPFGFGATVG